MSPETLEAFHDTLKKHFKKLKANKDLDNLKVLRNRILTILDNNARKFSDMELKIASQNERGYRNYGAGNCRTS